MGVSIYGINLNPITLDDQFRDPGSECSFKEPYTLKGFERSLQKEEVILFDEDGYEEDDYSKKSVSMSYSTYGDFRNNFSISLTGKTSEEIFSECSELHKKSPYPNPLYHIINFADNEGYIGPKAVKEMAKHLKSKKVKELRKQISPNSSTGNLIKIILETAEMENGYIRFS